MSPVDIEFPTTTERLTIRPMVLDDAAALHELYSDPEAMKRLTSEIPQTVQESQQWVQDKIDLHDETGLSLWTVVLTESGEIIGDAGLQLLEDNETVEVGARIIRRVWHRGYGREAAAAVIEAGFEQLGLLRIVGTTGPGNTMAISAMRAHGMEPVGTEDHYGTEWVVYEVRPAH